eukprot:4913178-Amphidinium_carterae.1
MQFSHEAGSFGSISFGVRCPTLVIKLPLLSVGRKCSRRKPLRMEVALDLLSEVGKVKGQSSGKALLIIEPIHGTILRVALHAVIPRLTCAFVPYLGAGFPLLPLVLLGEEL